ncbi:unnamed protein product [Cylicocyclus nassatus]|uniref:Uncharacterized protein n=1 Tax=Cylicocyclus nassatus TaxID=53992 RepID=A0AA36GWY4_CYLNA|nr:unnamed protein product [Cylicocyclus nassatus]
MNSHRLVMDSYRMLFKPFRKGYALIYVMTRYTYQLLGSRSLSSGRGRVLRYLFSEVLLPLLVGISLGYVLGLTFGFEETDSVDHLVQFDDEITERSLFFLRCIILVHPDAKKPHSFMNAIKDTYGSICNQTMYITNSEEIKKKAGDKYVVAIESNSNGFYWNYFNFILQNSAEIPAQWTFVGDEQVYLSVHNLRKLVQTVNHKQSIMFGRVFVQKSILYRIFPLLQPERIALQSGIVFSHSAIKDLSQCKGLLLPRATESRLYACAKQVGIRIVDPIDEEGMHLFHERDLKTLVPEGYIAEHKHGDKFVKGCCSDHAITFGQMSYKDLRLADFGSLHWSVFGIGGLEEVNASYAIDPKEFLPKTTQRPKVLPPKKSAKSALAKEVKLVHTGEKIETFVENIVEDEAAPSDIQMEFEVPQGNLYERREFHVETPLRGVQPLPLPRSLHECVENGILHIDRAARLILSKMHRQEFNV